MPAPAGNNEDNTLNLTKFLSTSGVASRRKSAELTKTGHVTLNGITETNPATRVGERDSVCVDGSPVHSRKQESRHYIMLHKPRGYVCTSNDVHAEKKAIDLIRLNDGARLFSAGRLDKNSEGLILFSDDGDFVERLTHPSHEVRKTYEVSTDRPLTHDECCKILNGITDNGELLRALRIDAVTDCKYRLILGEGKNREIRRMMEALGVRTKRLKRIAVGRLFLGGLPPGKWRELTDSEKSLAFGNESEHTVKKH